MELIGVSWHDPSVFLVQQLEIIQGLILNEKQTNRKCFSMSMESILQSQRRGFHKYL